LSFTPNWSFSGISNDPYVQYNWVDATSNTALDGNSGSFCTAYSYNYNFEQKNYNIICKLVYTPSTNQTVKVRVTATQTGGIRTVLETDSSAYVKAMNATFALNALDTMSTTGDVSVGGNLNVTGTSTSLVTKASGLVNAGVDVVLGNLKARIPTSGNRSLQLSTVSGTYTVYGSGVYYANGVGGATIDGASPLSVTTTPAYLRASNNFTSAGQTDTWTIVDTGAGLAWRITMIIGSGYNNNMISIERLV
jgi:hypothetical protein